MQDLFERAKTIREKVNTVERLHKTCQLTELDLTQPIFNEARYLSRALADVLFYLPDNKAKAEKHLDKAELAANNGINDAVDTLITFIKKSLKNLKNTHRKFQLSTSEYGDEYTEVLEYLVEVDGLVIKSRGDRDNRVDIYCELADEKHQEKLEKISNFALKLAQIEAVAQKVTEASSGIKDPTISNYIRSALDESNSSVNFELHLQPKYQLENDTKKCIGAECLIRLYVDGNPFPPSVFIDYAEKSGLIVQIDDWVLKNALKILKDNPSIPRLSINVSALDLLDYAYSSNVIALLKKHNIAPERLEIEITERIVLEDGLPYDHINELAKHGVKISIDDFGTGDTRFDYLANITVHVIKVDMSLVQKFKKDSEKYSVLLKAIAAVGKTCEIEVIAEGIGEQDEDIVPSLVDEIGIKRFQGYLFGKPVPLNDFQCL